LDKEKVRAADPFKGTLPDVRGLPSNNTLTSNSASWGDGIITGFAPVTLEPRTRASTRITIEEELEGSR